MVKKTEYDMKSYVVSYCLLLYRRCQCKGAHEMAQNDIISLYNTEPAL